MYTVEIYGRYTCPYCVRANAILEDLKAKGLAQGEFHDMEATGMTKDELASLKGLAEVRTVPQIWVNGKHVGGCTDFIAFLASEGHQY